MYIHEYVYIRIWIHIYTYTYVHIYIYNFWYIKIYIQVLEDAIFNTHTHLYINIYKSRAHAVALHDIGMLMKARVKERRGGEREREWCHHQSVHAWLALHHADEREWERERESVCERERERKRCPSARARRSCAPRRSADEKEQERERARKQASKRENEWEREREIRERDVKVRAHAVALHPVGILVKERHTRETWIIDTRDMTYWY